MSLIIDPNTQQPYVDPLVERAQALGADEDAQECSNLLVKNEGSGRLRVICMAAGGCAGQFDLFGEINVQGDLGYTGELDRPVVECIEHVVRCTGRRDPADVTVLANTNQAIYLVKVRW